LGWQLKKTEGKKVDEETKAEVRGKKVNVVKGKSFTSNSQITTFLVRRKRKKFSEGGTGSKRSLGNKLAWGTLFY